MIQYKCHRDTGYLLTAAGSAVLRIQAKRNTVLSREIVFHDGTALVDLPETAEGIFVAKEKDQGTGLPTGALRVWDMAWDAPQVSGGGYALHVPLYGSALDGLTPDDEGNLLLLAELHVVIEGEIVKSQSIDLVIQPPVYTDEDPLDDPEAPFPLPASILVTGAQALSDPVQAQVRENLGLETMLCREAVTLPVGLDADAPADFSLAGEDGQFVFDAGRSRLWVYLGGQWRFTTWISG